MSANRKIMLGFLALLLPLGIATVVVLLPRLERPGDALSLSVLIWAVLVAAGLAYSFRWRKSIKDYPLAAVLSALYVFTPLLAVTLLLNRVAPTSVATRRLELMERFDPGPGEEVHLFLWDATRLRKFDVSRTDAAANTRPGDSLDVTLVRGALRLEYLAHVQPASRIAERQ